MYECDEGWRHSWRDTYASQLTVNLQGSKNCGNVAENWQCKGLYCCIQITANPSVLEKCYTVMDLFVEIYFYLRLPSVFKITEREWGEPRSLSVKQPNLTMFCRNRLTNLAKTLKIKLLHIFFHWHITSIVTRFKWKEQITILCYKLINQRWYTDDRLHCVYSIKPIFTKSAISHFEFLYDFTSLIFNSHCYFYSTFEPYLSSGPAMTLAVIQRETMR